MMDLATEASAPPSYSLLHRGYIARVLRFSHIIKRLRESGANARPVWENARILEIGCGPQLEFARVMQAHGMFPRHYTAISERPVSLHIGALIDQAQFSFNLMYRTKLEDLHLKDMAEGFDGTQKTRQFSHIFSLYPDGESCINDLTRLKTFLLPGGTLWFVQPYIKTEGSGYFAYYGEEARYGKHIKQTTETVQSHGLKVKNVFGQIATRADIDDHRFADVYFEEANSLIGLIDDYFDAETMACLFAPAFPAASSVCLFECQHQS